MTERQRQKEKAIRLVSNRYKEMMGILLGIDGRLCLYYQGLIDHSSADPDDPDDHHSLWELLAALKQLRLMATYPIDFDKIHQVIRLREGEWHRVQDMWQYQRGGLLMPGTRGATHYRWLPFQIFVLTAMYACKGWVDTEVPVGSRELLPTEREGEDGTIEDLRRLCTDFTFFAPRKTDKTGLSAYNNFLYFMLEDDDAEIYCCANSQAQSKLLYERTKSLIRQMDPNGRRIRFTATATNWREGQIRHAHLESLSAGGKAKDGLFAQLCCADEFGSAPYVNGKSDMGNLVNVVLSSMGPRREPMMFTSTTAGTIAAGPFIDKLNNMKRELLEELDIEWSMEKAPAGYDGRQRIMSQRDRWMILPLMPDDWQLDEEYLLTSKAVRRKVNPTLGVIAQHSFYEGFIAESRRDPSLMAETLSKLFNVYQSNKVTEWIKPDEVRPLQRPVRIQDCKAADGWVVIGGMDFSKGDDLHTITYLATRKNKETGSTEFFSDIDAWITEKALRESSIRTLYEKWIKEGWLHVCPGAVLQPSLPIDRIIHLIENEGVSFIRWGFDAYQSKDPINTLKAYLWDVKNVNPDIYVVPVSQTFASYNPAVLKIEAVIWSAPPLITLSMNPLWPWCFGNCVIAEDARMNNRKMIKRNPGSDACKVDPIQCLATCFILLDQIDGHLQKTES